MAFLNNRTSLFVIGGIIIFAIIGIIGMFLANPTGFLQRIAVIALIGIAIYFIARLITKANPQKREQRAFLRAAKKSKKRLQQKSGDPHVRSASQTTLTTLKRSTKKKSPVHLTVIDGKKGKKKNRASF
ncbi:SA1362 family protein [Neobacillus sp. PS3-40]|uniref:SA1362 family protein n=1 Tax=Neobacillus sp. PS3-40 TaxID=3070679 RepID=UPI0027E1292B|nr:SA1362 family protein [Neobacillus sp. PS3-40]WML45279.1 SA1362 family protein [Neobacillus sp. PS3-40]